jgi:guanylate kinase
MPSELKGKAIVFSAPSGAGKTTIVRHLLEHSGLSLGFSVSATTRNPRGNEQNGIDYHFKSIEGFQACIAREELVEWEEVYPGKYYGTLKSELERLWQAGKTVLFDVDVVGGMALRKALGPVALSVFVQPPNMKVLQSRLERRGTESPERLNERMEKASWEWEQSVHFDKILINDDLQMACDEAVEIVKTHVNSTTLAD